MNDKDYLIKGKYMLVNFCKGGAFGEVFFAKHAEKNYEVAIKFVSFATYLKIICNSLLKFNNLERFVE